MITIEMLNQSESLKGLTDAQKLAITTLSSNDEATVVGTKIGALHGQYDADILSISGISKADGEKTYDYLKRVLGDYKTKLDGTKTLSAQLEAQKKKVTELETNLAAGGSDEAVKQQLKDARHQVTQLQTQLTTKTDVSEPVKKILLAAAKDEILAKGTPDFIDDGNGGKKLVLRDAAGNTLNNPKNNLNPYTIEELVMETSLKDVIDTGKQQPGGGTKPNPQSDHRTVNLDLSTAKTQQEADVQIENYLLSTGLTRDNVEFGNKALEIRNENNVSSLPIR